MKLSTQAIAASSARHPWRLIGAWIVASVLAIAAIGVLLGDSLTTEGAPTNNPESERAIDVIARAFPRGPETATTDVVIVHSSTYTVDDPEFAAFVAALVNRTPRPYLTGTEPTVSSDRDAVLVPLTIPDDD